MQKLDKLRPPPIDPSAGSSGGAGSTAMPVHHLAFTDPQQGILIATPLGNEQTPGQTGYIASQGGSPQMFVAVQGDWAAPPGSITWTTAGGSGAAGSAMAMQGRGAGEEVADPALHAQTIADQVSSPGVTFTTTNTKNLTIATGAPAGVFYAPPAIQVNKPYTIIRRDSSMFLSSPTSTATGNHQSAFSLSQSSPFTLHSAFVQNNFVANHATVPTLNSATHNSSSSSISQVSPSPSLTASKFRDPLVAQRIIVSVGLPLATSSLSDFIREGQPPAFILQTGSTGHVKGRRNFPNCDSPPPVGSELGDSMGGNNSGSATTPPPLQQLLNAVGGGATTGPPSFVVVDSSAESTSQAVTQGGGWSVESNDGSLQGTGMDVTSRINATFHPQGTAIPASSAFDQPATPLNATSVLSVGMHRQKSENEMLTDLLHFHANFFPPPPPPRLPPQERRRRVELWYHYANKWDITRRLPPPPRTPLPEMEMEYKLHLKPLTRVPYHGNDWLDMCMRWFDVVQQLFDYPEENTAIPLHVRVVLDHAVLG